MNHDQAYLEILKTVTSEILKKTNLDDLTNPAYSAVDYREVELTTNLISGITGNLYSTLIQNK